jgi:hypothetical protein
MVGSCFSLGCLYQVLVRKDFRKPFGQLASETIQHGDLIDAVEQMGKGCDGAVLMKTADGSVKKVQYGTDF